MSENNKWLMFKNFMHNELGVTKEDIKMWIEEAAEKEAKRLVAQEFKKFSVKEVIKDIVISDEFFGSKTLKREISQELVRQIMERFSFKDIN